MFVEKIMTEWKKNPSNGFLMILLIVIPILWFTYLNKDNQLEGKNLELQIWANRLIECEQDKIIRLDKSIQDMKDLVEATKKREKLSDTILLRTKKLINKVRQ